MKGIIILILVLFTFSGVYAQPSERFVSRKDYIEMWKDEAISQMVKYGIPASVTLAQGILESADGNSELAKYANNHFGIKCHGWDGPGVFKDDDKKDECFRKYTNALESFEDHSKFLAHRSRYAELFTLKVTDYEGWAKGLKKAGYATNPKYASMLVSIIELNELHKYDKMEAVLASNEPVYKLENPQNKLVLPKIELSKHVVQYHSRAKYVTVKKGDTYYKIAKEFEMSLWQLYKYNDCEESTKLKIGERIYLQPKRNKVNSKFYTVKSGETLRSIGQQEGVKLKKLNRINGLTIDSQVKAGQKIRLK